eukprot:gnl/TRDRNA2_/TRDRNA2_139243_c1_seq2.p1 gnl/TRDRNA2_/TRDRNA2_139243_c1~~gnl/TRDRNA2_/TRDRNA2_139243_c1_seq2.p1  ORF type:complete len:176 (+),score=31.70 gnl/TRDRNA2_/TRDRNA2_139243_c1_seq2:2-529(+)
MEVLSRLEDDVAPKHTDNVLTAESLQEAFPDMKPEQVKFIIDWLTKEVRDRALQGAPSEEIMKLDEIFKVVDSIAEQTRTVALTTSIVMSRVREVERSVAFLKAGHSQVQEQVAGMSSLFAEVREEGWIGDAIANDEGEPEDLGQRPNVNGAASRWDVVAVRGGAGRGLDWRCHC